MAENKDLNKLLKEPFSTPVYYFASSDEEILRQAAQKTCQALLKGQADAEITRCEGPEPKMGEIIAAAGAISFFGTPRVVQVWEIQPQSMEDKDVAEFAAIFESLENAVLVVTCFYKDKKTQTGKKAKLMFEAAKKAGFAELLEKPTRRENLDFLHAQAAALGAQFAPGAAEELLERAGESRPLLQNEVGKLAAFCGYGKIEKTSVTKHGAQNIQADIFHLAGMVTAGQRAKAQEKLCQLLAQKNEAVAIAAVLSSSFVDMYRARAGQEAQKSVAEIAEDFGYKNDYRVKKAKEAAGRYTAAGLRACVLCLFKLDKQLKSAALQDKSPLLQAALAQLILLGER